MAVNVADLVATLTLNTGGFASRAAAAAASLNSIGGAATTAGAAARKMTEPLPSVLGQIDAFAHDAGQQWAKVAANVNESVNSVGGALGRLKDNVAQYAPMLRMAAAAGIALFAKSSVDAAIAAEEAGSAFDTTFGPAADRASRFVEEFANRAGFANYQLEQMMAVTGNVVQGLGATEDQSFALSQRMVRLAADVASFSNAEGGAQAVLQAMQSAINGEREALKTYGLALSEVEVQQLALQMTGKATVDELTRMDKALATVELAYQKAAKAVGDLDRTEDSHANTIRRVSAQFEDLKVSVGQALLPVLDSMLPMVENLTGALGGLFGALGKVNGAVPALITGLGALALGAGPVGAAIAGVAAMAVTSLSAETDIDRLREAVYLFGRAATVASADEVPALRDAIRALGFNELADKLYGARENFGMLTPVVDALTDSVNALARALFGLPGETTVRVIPSGVEGGLMGNLNPINQPIIPTWINPNIQTQGPAPATNTLGGMEAWGAGGGGTPFRGKTVNIGMVIGDDREVDKTVRTALRRAAQAGF